MDEFDKLKNSWQNQEMGDATAVKIDALKIKAENQIVKHQRKLLISNAIMTIAFSAVFAVIYWVWNSFSEESIWFYIGMGIMAVLLLTFLALQWMGLQYKGRMNALEPMKFIKRTKKQLRHNRRMLSYGVPIYTVILTLAFYIYFYGLFQDASWEYWLIAYGGTTAYILFIVLISRKKSKKKIAEIDEMISYLEEWEKLLME